ncbi:unnamed protein product [Caenorhabditis angaria]|uniref:Uncharacterized protein n=1 Tax=Caenorhabditis angaria TaxID=860376 RepID=A0A9P1IVI1_9PELO|nr:unnamed protein product [Caenorhabditis angaria]
MPKLLFLLLIFGIFGIEAQLRLCEAEGSCRHCADNRYSYYRCRMQDDCFIGEVCDNGFCCPNVAPTFSLQREPTSPTQKETCPDGFKFERRCSKHSDCTHKEEICIEEKCCKREKVTRLL